MAPTSIDSKNIRNHYNFIINIFYVVKVSNNLINTTAQLITKFKKFQPPCLQNQPQNPRKKGVNLPI